MINKFISEKNLQVPVVLGDLYERSILLGYVGSISHGTYNPDHIDDVDLMNIVIPGKEYIFGLKTFGSRGTKILQRDEWDIVTYEVSKFVGLLAKCNPNVMGLLWLPENMYVKKTYGGEFLVNNRNIFSSKLAYTSFVGYAHSQLSKLQKCEYHGYMGAKRKEMVDKYNYDVKHGSHLIRLLKMGMEFVKTGEMNVHRKDADMLREIKVGKWSLEKVKRTAMELFKEFEVIKDESNLPERPDMDMVNYILVSLYEEYYGYV